jgi:PAS domain S-box-containing protein
MSQGTRAGGKEVATPHSTPTRKEATVNYGHEVLLHELEALRRSEGALRDFIETSTIGLHWVGADGTILWVNQAELDLLGYAREEYVGRNIAEFHADESVINDMLGGLSRGETLRDYPARLRHRDGSIRHVLVDSSVLFEDGNFVHTRCFTRDVTNCKHTEESLRKSEERFRLATRATNDAIWDIDLKTNTVSWNETYTTLYGRPLERSDSWQWWVDSIHAEDRERTVGGLRTAISSGASSWTCEYRFQRADSKWAHIYDRAYIARDASGNAWRVIGAMQDLTDRKQAEATLRESEERLKNAEYLAHLGHWSWDPKTNKAICSEEYCRIYGQPVDCTTCYEDFLKAVVPQDRERVERVIRDALAKKTGYTIEFQIAQPTGGVRTVRTFAELVLDEQGSPARLTGTCQDITDVRRAQEESTARQKLESVGVLAAGIAHDFNNLLGGILAEAELMAQDLPKDSSAAKGIYRIKESTIRGAEIVRELMVYSGQDQKDLNPIDISRLVDEMLELLKVSISKRAVLQVDLPEDLPPVFGNAPQIRQVVMNLVTNASEAIGDKEGVITVRTSRMTNREDLGSNGSPKLPAGGYVQLEVSDTGSGISEETRAKIFDPFFSTKFAGRGLGLAVVQGIVREHGAAINVLSVPGQGTTFQVLLPCLETTAGRTSEARPETEEPRLSREATVLIVEDEVSLREAVAKMLRRNGFQVLEAGDGTSAVDLLRVTGDKIDVILLDMTIPGAASAEVVAEAAKARPAMRVVLTSAYSQESVTVATDALKVHRFIRKPFHLADLAETLRNILSVG